MFSVLMNVQRPIFFIFYSFFNNVLYALVMKFPEHSATISKTTTAQHLLILHHCLCIPQSIKQFWSTCKIINVTHMFSFIIIIIHYSTQIALYRSLFILYHFHVLFTKVKTNITSTLHVNEWQQNAQCRTQRPGEWRSKVRTPFKYLSCLLLHPSQYLYWYFYTLKM